MAKRFDPPPPLEPRAFRSPEEIDLAIAKLRRRIEELEHLDVKAAELNHTSAISVARSNVRETIRDVFGSNSPEFKEHQHLDVWSGAVFMGMDPWEAVKARERGRLKVIGILEGLRGRLEEKKDDMSAAVIPAVPSTYFDRLNLHPRIADVARDLFMDGHDWEAVFAASKALVNFIPINNGKSDTWILLRCLRKA